MGLSHEDAEGIVQDLFIIIWEKRKALRFELSFKAYLYTIAKRLVIKKVRRNAQQKGYLTALMNSTIDYYEDVTDVGHDQNELLQKLKAQINNLPATRKEIFLLSKETGLTNDEIALQLNISKRTVENHLYRATKSLRKFLTD